MNDEEKVIRLVIELDLCRNQAEAVKWYKDVSIPSLGEYTAEQLVDQGQAITVFKYLTHIDDGGFA